MKLLTKREVDTAKAQDRKREMDEGLKLARKVDALRELLPEEEAALAKFRTETLAAIQAELKPAQEELDITLQALAVAKSELIMVRIPLDGEWEQARAKVIEAQGLYNDAKELLVQARNDAQVVQTEREIAEQNQRDAQLVEQNAISLWEDSVWKQDAAEKSLAAATVVHDAAVQFRIDSEKVLTIREQTVLVRENDAKVKEDSLQGQDEDLRKRERLLADRQALFERNLKRNLN